MLHNLLDTEESPAAFVDASKVLFTHRSGGPEVKKPWLLKNVLDFVVFLKKFVGF